MKTVVIIGASSGIGYALAEAYLKKDFVVIATARRLDRLDHLKQNKNGHLVETYQMDVLDLQKTKEQIDDIFKRKIDIFIYNAGVGFQKASLEQELTTVDINARSFLAIAAQAFIKFKAQGSGTLVGVSSLAALRSSAYSPEYHATKAFMSSYLQGLRYRAFKQKLAISVVDIKPGFVDTELTKGQKGMFWVATAQKAANQILEAIDAKVKVAYITKRYRLLAFLLKTLPDWIFMRAY